MAKLYRQLSVPVTTYVDRNFLKRGNTRGNYLEALRKSTTVYVGNLSFYTSEDQIYEIFSKCGDIRRIIMGLDKFQSTPCGFCFVLFYTREDTEHAVKYLNGTVLDGRIIRVDIDWGFEEGRQYGRGRSGGQVRDELRDDYDADRGGWGRIVEDEMTAEYGFEYEGRGRRKRHADRDEDGGEDTRKRQRD